MSKEILEKCNLMQLAVDAVHLSQHDKNKIAATVAVPQENGTLYTHSGPNIRPARITDKFSAKTKIGNASNTVHAEVSVITHAAFEDHIVVDGGDIYITDLPCPNCVKAVVEAGIRNIYIDHKGFGKDFAVRRMEYFNGMSKTIAENSGVGIHIIHRKEGKIDPIVEEQPDLTPAIQFPPEIIPMDGMNEYEAMIAEREKLYGTTPFATAIGQDAAGKSFFICVLQHPTIGQTTQSVLKLEDPQSKYSYILQPVNRLMMVAARNGLRPLDGTLHSNDIPTARELVNLVGTHITALSIGHTDISRDEHGLAAMTQLNDAKILDIS